MDANQIEKLKALAVAATPGPWAANNWTCHAPTTIKSGDIVVAETMGFGRHSSECAIDAAYIAEANPAAMLELIAEVERLRAELAAGAARQGGNTSESAGLLDHAKTAETRMNSGFEGGHLGSAPAAGTVEKDAERYRAIRRGDVYIEPNNDCNEIYDATDRVVYTKTDEEFDEAIDDAIAAHTKAGKANA